MAKNKVINTVLTVRDNMSGGLVKAAQNAKKFGKAIDSSMISATRSVVAFKNKSVAALQDYAKKAGAAIVAGTTAVATGLSALTLKSALAADDLNTLAKQSGFSTADIQKWQYASDLIDVSIDDIVKSAAKMKKNMISTSSTTVDAWNQLGIKVKDSNGHLRNSTTVFYETLTALSKVQNETERDTLAMTLFGKSADSLAGIVDDGGAALQELAGKAEKAGVILSQDTLDSANALNDKVDTLKATVKGFAGKVGSELAGRASKALDVVGSHFSKAFNTSPMDWLNGKLDTLMAKLDSWIAGGGLERLADLLVNGVQLGAQKAGDMLKKAGDALKWCKDHSDTLVNVLKGLAAAWAVKKVLDFNNGLADCVGNIGGIIKTVLTMTGVLGGQAAATGTATVAQTGLNAAMTANPIGAVILAIEALIAVGVLLYKNWDTIKAGAQSLWNKFKDVSIRIGTALQNGRRLHADLPLFCAGGRGHNQAGAAVKLKFFVRNRKDQLGRYLHDLCPVPRLRLAVDLGTACLSDDPRQCRIPCHRHALPSTSSTVLSTSIQYLVLSPRRTETGNLRVTASNTLDRVAAIALNGFAA